MGYDRNNSALIHEKKMKKIKYKSRINAKVFAAVLNQIRSRPSLDSVGVEKYRSFLEKSSAIFKPDNRVTLKPVSINSISGAWLIPRHLTGSKTILYLHGGGFIAGSVNSHKDLGSRIALASDAKMLIINYRLAPENKFPAALNDVFDSYRWLLNNRIAPKNIIIAGDSAGGGLVMSLLLKIKQWKLEIPGGAVLISPWVDLECKGKSHSRNRTKDPMLTPEMLAFTIKLYTGGECDLSDPMISPINGDLRGLCPIFIQVGSCEILEDDAIMLAENAQNADVPVELEIWDDMFHVWHYFSRYLSSGREAIKRIGHFIKNIP